ncbi:MAG: hypothetical protein ACE15C_20750 [Phycisphaerae bacterium]
MLGLVVGVAYSGTEIYTGSLSWSNHASQGLTATGNWDQTITGPDKNPTITNQTTSITWTVKYDPAGLDGTGLQFMYAYQMSLTANPSLTGFFLQTSLNSTPEQFLVVLGGNPSGPEDVATMGWIHLPTYPGTEYGLHFSASPGGLNGLEIKLYTNRIPVWGDFITGDGNGNEAYNNGFAYPSANAQQAFGVLDNNGIFTAGGTGAWPTDDLAHAKILVPDSVSALPPVPEPLTMVSAFMAISGIGLYLRKRTRVQA